MFTLTNTQTKTTIEKVNNLVTRWYKQNYSIQPNIKDVRFFVKVKKLFAVKTKLFRNKFNNGLFSYQSTIKFVDSIFTTHWLSAL